jgi:hypothetical protein
MNYGFFMCVLTTLSSSAMWVDYTEYGTRLEILFTIVLTTSTVKFLVADQLPKVPYFTALEWYMLLALFFEFSLLLLSTAAVVVANRPDLGAELAAEVDRIGVLVWGACWGILHVYIACRVRRLGVSNVDHPIIANPGEPVQQNAIPGGKVLECYGYLDEHEARLVVPAAVEELLPHGPRMTEIGSHPGRSGSRRSIGSRRSWSGAGGGATPSAEGVHQLTETPRSLDSDD